MAKPKKPRKLKYPKKPKAGASLAAKQNYLRRRKDVDKKNRERMSKYSRDLKAYEKVTDQIRRL